MGAAAASGEGAVKQTWWPTHLMRGTGPLERKSSIIQREGGERVQEKEVTELKALVGRYLACTVCKGLDVDHPWVRNHQLPQHHSSAYGCLTCQKTPCRGVSARDPRQNFWHSYSAMKSVRLCSWVSSLCRTSLWNNSFTLAATQYGHNQSCHQPAVQTWPEEWHSYKNPGVSIQSHNAWRPSPFGIAKVVIPLSHAQRSELVRKNYCTGSRVNFHFAYERLRRPALPWHVMKVTQ